MNRRYFLKSSAVLGSLSLFPQILTADTPKKRRFKVVYDFGLHYDEKAFPVRLWNPLPFDAAYQKVRQLRFGGNYDDYNINTKNPYDARVFYAQWHKSADAKQLKIQLDIETTDRSMPLARIEKASSQMLPIPPEIRVFLKPTAHIPTTGKIAKKVAELTHGMQEPFEKVRAIYDWVTEVTFRDPKVIGCGVGDAGKMMQSGYFGGKCTDISSLFVAFLRAAGVPAREVFGIRLGRSDFSPALGKANAKGFADISGAQHCRVEYYIAGIGWIPSDPADITKLELVEGLKYHDKRVQALKERYLHSWEMNWIGFNWARDFILWPKPEQYPLNMLGYPYGEVEDEVLDYYNPKNFAYRITSQEI